MPTVSLSELLGQPDVTAYLRGIVGRGRYANAYLFHGPPGVGKGTAALAFGRAALCDRVPGAAPRDRRSAPAPTLFGDPSPAPAAAGTADDACGACPACTKCASLRHPDLKFLFPVSGEEKLLDALVEAKLQELRDEPLHAFHYDKAASIRLSLTRELQRELAYRPFEAARRVVVIRDCDRMREDQYSALLKSVEEPGATTVWVLTSSRPSRLPATIRSRCQSVRFAPLPESLVREVLVARAQVAPREAKLLAALSNGSLARALALAAAGATAGRDATLAMLESALKGDYPGLFLLVQKSMKFGKVGREELRRSIEFQQLWLRDLLRVRHGASTESLANADREPELRRLASTLDAREVRRRLMVLEEALRAIEGNVSPELAMFSTLARVAGGRLGEGRWPAHGQGRWDY